MLSRSRCFRIEIIEADNDETQRGRPIPFGYGMLAPVGPAQIEYFVTVAEEGQLARAALRLHVSQPPLSRQIKSLEEELGAPLFVRTRWGRVLSPAGVTFLRHARRVLTEVEQAKLALWPAEPS